MHRPARTAGAFRRVFLPSVMAIATMLLAAPAAQAALVPHADYTSAASPCGYLGQSDQNGVFYSWCSPGVIARWDRNGVRLADVAAPEVGGVGDVAPSPDGTYLYVTNYGNPVRRLVRETATNYKVDIGWKLGQVVVWNVPTNAFGAFIATDGRGDIYLSNGSLTTEGQRSVAKYRPDGTLITAFGDWGREPGNWVTNQDIAVSRDGRRVFVGENCGTNCTFGTAGYNASRITRYDFTPGGTYRFTRILSAQGPTGGNPFPDCNAAGAVHSNYSLTLDYWDRLYATSTTCGRIQMYDTKPDPAQDAFVGSLARWDDQPRRSHYVASDWAGRIRAYEWNMVFSPRVPKVPALPLPALEPLPTPDVKAPVLTAITMPATTTTQAVQVTVTATDDRGVAEMQLAREDGTWGPWQPFSTPVTYRLSDGFGTKGVYVRVRDMGGNESAAVYRTISYTAPVDPNDPPPPANDVADPVLTSIAIPALTATHEIQVTIEATDDTAVRHVRFANEDGNFSAWRVFAATSTWTLTANNGPKAVYAQVRDGAGRESAVLSARTRVDPGAPPPPPPGQAPDTVAPVLTTFTLPAETTTQALTATLAATDVGGVAQVRFANEDGNWTGWQAFAATRQWTLSANYGGKLVYAQVRDGSGNESLVLTARTSYVRTVAGPVDAADPALTAVVIPDPTRTAAVTVSLTATDDVGVTQVRLANEDGTWGPWVAYGAEVPHQLTAGNTYKVVYVQVRDAVGRESNVLFARTLVAP